MIARDRVRPLPEDFSRARTLERLLTRATLGLLLVAASVLSPMAQGQPQMVLQNGSTFEGNADTSILKLPVNFAGVNTSTVTGFASAIPLSGVGFNPATGGASCGGGVDFVQFSNVPFSIPPNTPNGTLSVNIAICPDAVIEPNEHIFVSLTNVGGGAFCTAESCAAIGTIVNDDGPPSMSIGNISVSEPVIGTRTVSFPVTLHHTTSQPVSARFATRDGTARARSLTNIGDYVGTSGPVNIAADTLSGSIQVTILGDGFSEPNETFFVDLSLPTNATILDGTGQATIRDTTLSIGGFDLSPDHVIVENGETIAFDVVWTVPEGQVWRDLKSIDFRIGAPGDPVLWVRWDELSNTFSLCEIGGKDAAQADHRGGPPVHCGPGAAPGSAAALVTSSAQLLLADTTVVGSGPTGQSVALHLVVSFGPEIKTHSYVVGLAAADDFGNEDKFVRASEVTVE
jgi:hypothetical protein